MDPPPAAKVKKVLHVTYLIATLDVTWMFLQFSITPEVFGKKAGI